MKNVMEHKSMLMTYCIVLISFLLLGLWGSRTVTVLTENAPVTGRTCIIIDPGHGGEDGGATSCTGVFESKINLEIALRLNDMMNLLGYDTLMIRKTDISVYTAGETIAAKKVSDLKRRVEIVNGTENALLLSIHQNYFSDSQYSGAQVFYPKTVGSEELAKSLQSAIIKNVNPSSRRAAKKVDGVYLMEHIDTTGVLIECGFLSNPEEEAKLRSPEYQKVFSAVIASVCSSYLSQNSQIA